MRLDKSKEVFDNTKRYIPGGVNSPVRAFKNLSITPPVISKGKGCRIFDIDGNEYIDFVLSWGAMILGHCDPDVVNRMKEVVEDQIAFGAPTEIEYKMAKLVCETAQIDMVRFVNSGTEATMTAVRLAKGYTGKKKIVKFAGCYHGHHDIFLKEAGSAVAELRLKRIDEDIVQNTIVVEYNNLDSVEKAFKENKDEIAAVIIEPVAGNMGVVPAKKEFLQVLREICNLHGSLLIFDEVITGFRLSLKGARALYNVEPDLVTFGKIIGGGLPCGAVGGKKEIMECLAPQGNVFQAGTMSGNPIVMSAGYATIKKLKENPHFYSNLEMLAGKLEKELTQVFSNSNLTFCINRVGSMLTIFFGVEKVENFEMAKMSDLDLFRSFAEYMIKNHIYVPSSQFEAMFLSVAHSENDVEKFVEIAEEFCSSKRK
ncbi:glutamate-1-semialdehyde 2,1-aminomutase [Caldicellulosiruptor bescii]|uniref:Glutamate-1-semialdehyde 2,1-aminomutase n=2 Tax=Caldicellulosiruptor bescii TaxID=31899 RepID=GSA_CALBD|nr:glutamate-1-semialdehyde 2,1-aminomutase [Caldicellulosiruptor bescii]B9MRJ7.1 RecName: Full=Glutamate-1-semialdehyde 2,1-aminomutase; Short=GSA; AltName: Full=Glutamate-1-semialdehyde aminotransferase; Short=GSA-AT [Caldicellulosiruptor bescii DSM 6725]ACM60301.1 glutamate-1-semialdehyde-2,1-aminomutase [Caldicellulosiruptor bescii DSM 6725]PBC87716.1 glutamate-1-semialdehyde 2,1-aminomutase [Caldicellulosiruptor bescii]PBC90649.1 glutamate-1-semialdehyde 2,1-aminomutase [Caldicellulosirupt